LFSLLDEGQDWKTSDVFSFFNDILVFPLGHSSFDLVLSVLEGRHIIKGKDVVVFLLSLSNFTVFFRKPLYIFLCLVVYERRQ